MRYGSLKFWVAKQQTTKFNMYAYTHTHTHPQALILVDTAGQVTVPSIRSLKNLLGDHPEPGLAITHACNGQFFILDVSELSLHMYWWLEFKYL